MEAFPVSYGSSVGCSSDHADPEAGWVCGHGSLPPTAARVSVSTCCLAKISAQCENRTNCSFIKGLYGGYSEIECIHFDGLIIV